MVSNRKIGVIGCGFVGSACAFTLMQSGLFTDIILLDVDKNRAEGEAMDISHGIPLATPMHIYAGSYKDIADCGIVLVTAGANQKPDETRLDLVHKNVSIYQSIIPEIMNVGFDGILLVVSNPVDILTYVTVKLSGLPDNQVFGSGTVLDTARLKAALGKHLQVDNRSVHAFVIGEHGDSEFAAWSSANISGIDLEDFCELCGHKHYMSIKDKMEDQVRNSAYEIIEKKKATFYGIAMSVRRICECIVRNERSILSVSSMLHGEYGLSDIALSIPTIVGNNGVEHHIPVELDDEETKQLQQSVVALRKVIKEISL